MKVKKIITVTKSVDFDIVSATLLTVQEAKQLPQEILTAAHDSWWLRSPGDEDRYAACVFGEDAHIYDDGEYVDMRLGVRPVIIFKSSELGVGDKFKAFDYEWTVISSNMALCNNVIGRSPFCKAWKASDANDYEKSDIKEYVDNWFAYNCYNREDDIE